MQPRIVECGWKCETKSDEVHVFFSYFIFTQLDNAQPRRRTRVQSILFNIFSELARRLIPSGSAKTTLLAARLPNEQRTYSADGPSMGNRQLYNKTFSSLGRRCSVSDRKSYGDHWWMRLWRDTILVEEPASCIG
jgi:hypothetical protein